LADVVPWALDALLCRCCWLAELVLWRCEAYWPDWVDADPLRLWKLPLEAVPWRE
jgi:hypothetical protein